MPREDEELRYSDYRCQPLAGERGSEGRSLGLGQGLAQSCSEYRRPGFHSSALGGGGIGRCEAARSSHTRQRRAVGVARAAWGLVMEDIEIDAARSCRAVSARAGGLRRAEGMRPDERAVGRTDTMLRHGYEFTKSRKMLPGLK